MKIRVRAPASTANVGPGFDCVAVALDLWNELEVEDGDGEADLDHIGVRAFAQLAPVASRRFRWIDRIPYERGLGSSASVIALGLVAAALSLGRKPDPEELLPAGVGLEGHADNPGRRARGRRLRHVEGGASYASPAAFRQCRSRSFRRRPCRPRCPAPAFPPRSRTAMRPSRRLVLPRSSALHCRAARPSCSPKRCRIDCHEPCQAPNAPLLGQPAKASLPRLLASPCRAPGPTVIVWAREDAANECAHALGRRFPGERVVPLAVSQAGAGRTDE